MYKGLHNTIPNGRNQIVQYFHTPKPRLEDIRFSQLLVSLGTPILSPSLLTLIFQIYLKYLIYYHLYINLLTFKKRIKKEAFFIDLLKIENRPTEFPSSQSGYSSSPWLK